MGLTVRLIAAGEEVYQAAISHSLNTMADKVEIYFHLWRPEHLGIRTAEELIEPIAVALTKLKLKPEHFKGFNPKGSPEKYEDLVEFMKKYLEACQKNPHALVNAVRVNGVGCVNS